MGGTRPIREGLMHPEETPARLPVEPKFEAEWPGV
jgi:hypothetical protein